MPSVKRERRPQQGVLRASMITASTRLTRNERGGGDQRSFPGVHKDGAGVKQWLLFVPVRLPNRTLLSQSPSSTTIVFQGRGGALVAPHDPIFHAADTSGAKEPGDVRLGC